MRLHILSIVLLLFLTSSCSISRRAQNENTSSNIENKQLYHFPYDLQKPDVTFELPKSLVEISGIALTQDNKAIVAIQDEEGILFTLDKKTGALLDNRPFHKKGDYEDIEVVGDVIYVIKSSGSLYKLENASTDSLIRTKYKVNHSHSHDHDHDMEGLCFDKKNNRLLIACKGELSKKETYKLHKGLCAFNLSTMKWDYEPAFAVSLDAIETFIRTKGTPEMLVKFEKILAENDGVLGFAPSAVAIHPFTENIYIISSKGKALMVLNQENTILHLEKLNKKIHLQPEGMLFDTDGTLYISNEGKDTTAKIYRFDMH